MKTCLTIAGSDPSGGAGVQADLKTFAANGVYGMSVITVLTAQNTTGVYGIHEVPAEFAEKQLSCVFDDIYPDAVKIGMQASADSIKVIAECLTKYNAKNIVVDPVMVATSGSSLLANEAYKALCDYLLPMADIITPNLPEAEKLTGMTITSHKGMLEAAKLIRRYFDCAVLLKGGHALFCDSYTEFSGDDGIPPSTYVDVRNDRDSIRNDGNIVRSDIGIHSNDNCGKGISASTDLFLSADGDKPVFLYAERIDNSNTHGTGCTLSSAIAAGLAKGEDLKTAVRSAKEYVTGAIKAGLDLGKGRGPLNHIYRR